MKDIYTKQRRNRLKLWKSLFPKKFYLNLTKQ